MLIISRVIVIMITMVTLTMTYINWVYDALGINFIKEHRLKSLQVDYFEEIVKVEKVSLGLKIKDNKVYAMVKADGKLSTLLELEFTSR